MCRRIAWRRNPDTHMQPFPSAWVFQARPGVLYQTMTGTTTVFLKEQQLAKSQKLSEKPINNALPAAHLQCSCGAHITLKNSIIAEHYTQNNNNFTISGTPRGAPFLQAQGWCPSSTALLENVAVIKQGSAALRQGKQQPACSEGQDRRLSIQKSESSHFGLPVSMPCERASTYVCMCLQADAARRPSA